MTLLTLFTIRHRREAHNQLVLTMAALITATLGGKQCH